MLAGLDLIGEASGEDAAGVAVGPATAGEAAGGAEATPGIERGIGVTRETERGRDRGRAAGAAEDIRKRMRMNEKSYILAQFCSVPAFLLNLNVVYKKQCSDFTFGNICPRFS